MQLVGLIILIKKMNYISNLNNDKSIRVNNINKYKDNNNLSILKERQDFKLSLRKQRLKHEFNLKRNKGASNDAINNNSTEEEDYLKIQKNYNIINRIILDLHLESLFLKFKENSDSIMLYNMGSNMSSINNNTNNTKNNSMSYFLSFEYFSQKFDKSNLKDFILKDFFKEITPIEKLLYDHLMNVSQQDTENALILLEELSNLSLFNIEQVSILKDTILPFIFNYSILIYKLILKISDNFNNINSNSNSNTTVDVSNKEIFSDPMYDIKNVGLLKVKLGILQKIFINFFAIQLSIFNDNSIINNINNDYNSNYELSENPKNRICDFFSNPFYLDLLISLISNNMDFYNNTENKELIDFYLETLSNTMYILGNVLSDNLELSEFIIQYFDLEYLIQLFSKIITKLPDPCGEYLEDIMYVLDSLIFFKPISLNSFDFFLYYSDMFKEILTRLSIFDNQSSSCINIFIRFFTDFIDKQCNSKELKINIISKFFEWKLVDVIYDIFSNDSLSYQNFIDLISFTSLLIEKSRDEKSLIENILFYLIPIDFLMENNEFDIKCYNDKPVLFERIMIKVKSIFSLYCNNKLKECALDKEINSLSINTNINNINNNNINSSINNNKTITDLKKKKESISEEDKLAISAISQFLRVIYQILKINGYKEQVYSIMAVNEVFKALNTMFNINSKLDFFIVKIFSKALQSESMEIKKLIFSGGHFSILYSDIAFSYLDKRSEYRSLDFTVDWLKCTHSLLIISRELIKYNNIVKEKINDKGFSDILTYLQNDDNPIIYDLAIEILRDFFSDQDWDNNYDGYLNN